LEIGVPVARLARLKSGCYGQEVHLRPGACGQQPRDGQSSLTQPGAVEGNEDTRYRHPWRLRPRG